MGDGENPAATRLVPLRDALDAERFVEAALPGVYEAGRPWVDWLLDGLGPATSILREWMHRPSSEISVRRATLLVPDGNPVGGFISMDGAELAACRRSDAVAVMKLGTAGGKAAIVRRLEEGRALFPPVPEDALYLSRIWVVPAARRAGHGAALVAAYLAAGGERNAGGFRLDVCSGNGAALRLYRSFGFDVLSESVSERAAMTYVRLGRRQGRENAPPRA